MENKPITIGAITVLAIAFVLAIASAGYYRNQYREIQKQAPEVVTRETIKIVEVPGNNDQVEELKKKITDLQTRLKAKENVINDLDGNKQNRHQMARNWSGRNWLQNLREKNPERYQKMMDSYRKMNERMGSGINDRLAFLKELDTTGMSEEALKNHNELLAKLEALQELSEKINNAEEDEIQKLTMQRMREMGQCYQLFQTERDAALLDIGKKMGFNNEEAGVIRDCVKRAYDMTSPHSMFRSRGRRGIRSDSSKTDSSKSTKHGGCKVHSERIIL